MKGYLNRLIGTLILIAVFVALTACENTTIQGQPISKEPEDTPTMEPIVQPKEVKIEITWETGGKAVVDYTWAEYEALSPELKEKFFDEFGSIDEFEAWRKTASAEKDDRGEKPWETGGKAVVDYTWAEYEALSPELKEKFFDAFESIDEFEAWRKTASAEKDDRREKPWETGGKAVVDYTWAEYEALSPELKEAFFDAFETVEAFDKWMQGAKR